MLHPQRRNIKVEGALSLSTGRSEAQYCPLSALSGGLEDSVSGGVSIVRRYASDGRVAETPKALRKSGERGSGRRRREERRVSEGRYGDFERSDEGDVKGLS